MNAQPTDADSVIAESVRLLALERHQREQQDAAQRSQRFLEAQLRLREQKPNRAVRICEYCI
jgi:hypothetical protein